jgi:hypothetical protein
VVVGGGVTVPVGASTAPVILNAVNANPSVTLTLSTGSGMQTATVRVLGGSDAPSMVTLSPVTINVQPGGQATITVGLDIPAPAGGTMVAIHVAPTTGTADFNVTVPANMLSAPLLFVQDGTTPAEVLTATLGSSHATATVNMTTSASGSHLVINEVDYDQAATDNAEFVEIYNPTSSPIALTSVALILVNGSNMKEYARYPLGAAGMLPAGGYLVVSNGMVGAAPGALTLTPSGWPMTDAIQNGAPDGMLLLDTTANTVIDALSYEGSITAAIITGVTGTVNLVEGTPVATSKADINGGTASLVRAPNGQDTDNADADWELTTTITPGAANVVTQ